jgi:hypothetical protein
VEIGPCVPHMVGMGGRANGPGIDQRLGCPGGEGVGSGSTVNQSNSQQVNKYTSQPVKRQTSRPVNQGTIGFSSHEGIYQYISRELRSAAALKGLFTFRFRTHACIEVVQCSHSGGGGQQRFLVDFSVNFLPVGSPGASRKKM